MIQFGDNNLLSKTVSGLDLVFTSAGIYMHQGGLSTGFWRMRDFFWNRIEGAGNCVSHWKELKCIRNRPQASALSPKNRNQGEGSGGISEGNSRTGNKKAEVTGAKSERGAGNSNLGQHPTSAYIF